MEATTAAIMPPSNTPPTATEDSTGGFACPHNQRPCELKCDPKLGPGLTHCSLWIQQVRADAIREKGGA